ncbi:hypothetical protein TNCV_2268991 [Trichonephila clavipes]|nr:hypothetical protein TNCV_2268991 [Trichonephila clavipes]
MDCITTHIRTTERMLDKGDPTISGMPDTRAFVFIVRGCKRNGHHGICLTSVSRDLSFVKKGKFCRKEQRGIEGQQIDFVLKWLSRVGSEVGLTKGKLEPWASLFRVHNVDLLNSLHELMMREGRKKGKETREEGRRRKGRRRKKRRKESGEREEPALDGEKGLVRDWSGKTMNAEGEKDYKDNHRDEITDFVQSIPGFQECNKDIETWLAIYAEDSVDFKC